MSMDGPFAAGLPTGPKNLVYRAASQLAARIGVAPDVEIRLTKRLPAAAGIGGGSADAAATLLGCAAVWGVAADHPALADVALELGADVPICLAGHAAQVGGIGERVIAFADLPECGLVLANPGVALSTPQVFAARTGVFSRPTCPESWARTAQDLAVQLRPLCNDLTDAAISLAPEVGDALHALAGLPGCLLARMSGSGATCFGLFEHRAAAGVAAGLLAAARPGWWVCSGTLISTVDRIALQ